MLSYTFYLGTLKKKIGLAWQARFITVEKRAHFHFWKNILAGAGYDHHVSQLEFLVEN